MADELYGDRILRLSAHIPRLGRLNDAHGTASRQSKLCGSAVTADVKLDGERIADFAHEVEADALGRAAAACMAQHVVGKSHDALRALCDAMHAMLEAGGPPPQGEWAGLAVFESVRAYPERHASILLTFDATIAAVENALEKRIVSSELRIGKK